MPTQRIILRYFLYRGMNRLGFGGISSQFFQKRRIKFVQFVIDFLIPLQTYFVRYLFT